jgi:hypothetical protein
MHNVHEKMPVLIQTRWTMNFLAGPMTRTQIPALNQLVGAGKSSVTSEQPSVISKPKLSVEAMQPIAVASIQSPVTNRKSEIVNPKLDGSLTKPSIPAGVREYFLPQNFSLPEAFQSAQRAMPSQAMIQGVIYHPALLAAAQVRLLDRKYGVDSEITKAALVDSLDRRGIVRWDEFSYKGPSLDKVEIEPPASARFGGIDSPLNDSKLMTALQKDFTDWLFRNSEVTARANLKLKVFGGPDVSQAEFMTACSEAARDARDAEIEKKTSVIEKKIKSLEDKLGREERELSEDQSDLTNRNMESGANLLELGAGVLGFGRKKSVSTQFTKHRLAQNAKAAVEESIDSIAQYKKDLNELLRERDGMTTEINNRWGSLVNEISEVSIKPKKTDIYVNIFGVAWTPFYIVQAGDETMELPAFGAE